jgi:SAM-dependent methyltransferase
LPAQEENPEQAEELYSPAMDDHLRIEFNDWARAGRGQSMEQGHQGVGRQAIERLEIWDGARVLDVGCGSGWATRILAERAKSGRAVGLDISDEMIRIARETSPENIEFRVGTAEKLPFGSLEFTHVFSMESLYYYSNLADALREMYRVLQHGGIFITVIDLYVENRPSHQWINKLNVPVQLLNIAEYRKLLYQAGFVNIHDDRLFDPTPIPEDYQRGSFETREDYIEFRETGSLMLSGEV